MKRLPPSQTIAGLLLAAAFLMMGLALAGIDFSRRPPGRTPLTVEALVPSPSAVAVVPKGAHVGSSGYLTILRVSPTPVTPIPPDAEPPRTEVLPADEPAIDPAVAGGIRALFRTRPRPPERGLVLETSEYKFTQLRLVLIDGCFRADGQRGPLAVFPPRTRVFLKDGYLTVGQPGAPSEFQARVGEELFWEAYAVPISDRKSLDLVHQLCGPGAVLEIVPSPATAFRAREDANAATEYARNQKVSWATALQEVQACRRRMEEFIRRDNPNGPEILVSNRCGSTFVNPPNPGNCPPGTTFRQGNCFDREGRIAPVPAPPEPVQPPPAPDLR